MAWLKLPSIVVINRIQTAAIVHSISEELLILTGDPQSAILEPQLNIICENYFAHF